MKKQHLLPLSCLAILFASCVNDLDTRKSVNLNAIEPLVDYNVPITAGKASIVTLDDDTLAITTQDMIAKVPRYAVEENLLQVSYSDDEIYKTHATRSYWYYLAFEDTRWGDYDYNDIVFHARVASYQEYGKPIWNNTISLQPVALGSAVPIKIGILYKDANGQVNSKIVINDARKELYFDNPLFPLNTNPKKEIKQITRELKVVFESTTNEQLNLVWFIEANGNRFFAATTESSVNSTEMISVDGLPYGLSFSKKWSYPIEACNIKNAYPGFNQWLKTGKESDLLENSVKEFIFPTRYQTSEGWIDLWDYNRD